MADGGIGGREDDRGGFCGWLDMRVKLGWQTRWCELSSDTCTFARSHKKFDQSQRKMVKLHGISVRLIEESRSGKRFSIDHTESVEMKASSREDAQNWVRAIHEVQSRHFSMDQAAPLSNIGGRAEWEEALAEKDAEIRALKRENQALQREVHLLKYGTEPLAPEPEADGGYADVVGRIHNKVGRVTSLADLETLHTDSSDDDDALFEDAQQLFGVTVKDEWSDEEQERPRTDSFLMGSGGPGGRSRAAVELGSPTPEASWFGPPGAQRMGQFTQKVSQREMDELEDNTCCNSWAEQWSLRIGPDYKRTGAKAPSADSLYDFLGVDLFQAGEHINGISDRLQLPDVNFPTNGLPTIFVLNMQLPNCENPSMFSAPLDGPCQHIVYFFRLKEFTAQAALNPAMASPAVRLLMEYFKNAPNDEAFKGRMKLMMRVDKGLPRMFQRYNGKPTLLTKSSKITQSADHKVFEGAPSLHTNASSVTAPSSLT